ncbi:hypothetical protein, unlikely [Trypanosoma brucei brucei TREU927]|uniref:Uncharacterized protein n=1 Tax=Trypanosoma brucei brucei (strain 927/4 GUTat10.1) TaxID=185431 RepID=Q38CS5_TRYB2|nr:hypothetical protein, unlikely [Trypanosoma brucei brucei TREU927]EAN77395.1 hypothetical protein, unlikely [Trypanosoma brucei brucei TREU927]
MLTCAAAHALTYFNGIFSLLGPWPPVCGCGGITMLEKKKETMGETSNGSTGWIAPPPPTHTQGLQKVLRAWRALVTCFPVGTFAHFIVDLVKPARLAAKCHKRVA